MNVRSKLSLAVGVLALTLAPTTFASYVKTYSYVDSNLTSSAGNSVSASQYGTGNVVQFFANDNVVQTSQVRIDSTVGALSSAEVAGGTMGSASGTSWVLHRTFLSLDEIVSFGDWSLDLGYDGSLFSSNGMASYTVQATAYLVANTGYELEEDPFDDYGETETFAVKLDSFTHTDSVSNGSVSVDEMDSLNFLLAEPDSRLFDSLMVELSLRTDSQASNGGMASADFLNTFGFVGVGGAAVGNAVNFGVATPVPVPAAVYFLGSGVLAFMGLRRRSRAALKG